MPMPMRAQANARRGNARGKREAHEAGRENEIGRRQHIAPAMLIDHAAGEGPKQARQQQRRRENAEEPDVRQLQRIRDRIGKDGREVIGRTPGERLRDAERGDDDAAAHDYSAASPSRRSTITQSRHTPSSLPCRR